MNNRENLTIKQAVALIDGALDSLKFSAPENAHIFYERFETASANLKTLLPPADAQATEALLVKDLDEAQSYVGDLVEDLRNDVQSMTEDLNNAESCETAEDFVENVDSARAAIGQMLTKVDAFRKDWVS